MPPCLPEHAYNCSTASVVQRPLTRVKGSLIEGLQRRERSRDPSPGLSFKGGYTMNGELGITPGGRVRLYRVIPKPRERDHTT
ncbi:hypothetical protein K438DRAFT_1952744 [Mycena galopus ATCC 62051]|nr:hypothetical protein K438DRAFT_1952744 [Mycena galopus ATCC 62051]